MTGPSHLKLKRRFSDTEEPPEHLLLRHDASAAPARYVRQVKEKSGGQEGKRQKTGQDDAQSDPQVDAQFAEPTAGVKKEVKEEDERVFHLEVSPASVVGKKRGREEAIPTFVKRPKKRENVTPHEDVMGAVLDDESRDTSTTEARPLKRPGKGSAVHANGSSKIFTPKAETGSQRKEMEELAEYFTRQTALEEKGETSNEKTTPPRRSVQMTPRLSGSRSKELHQQRVASNSSADAWSSTPERNTEDTEMANSSPSSSDGYIYETYVLAPGSPSQHPDEDIGYLIIEHEDQDHWETYLPERVPKDDDKDFRSDDEDSNAEDYWGADYPEDEDESTLDRRIDGRADDSDEWDSDDDDDADYGSDDDDFAEVMMDPFSRQRRMHR